MTGGGITEARYGFVGSNVRGVPYCKECKGLRRSGNHQLLLCVEIPDIGTTT